MIQNDIVVNDWLKYITKSNDFNIHKLATFQFSLKKNTRSHEPELCKNMTYGWLLILPYQTFSITCLNRTLNRTVSCINETLNKVPM